MSDRLVHQGPERSGEVSSPVSSPREHGFERIDRIAALAEALGKLTPDERAALRAMLDGEGAGDAAEGGGRG